MKSIRFGFALLASLTVVAVTAGTASATVHSKETGPLPGNSYSLTFTSDNPLTPAGSKADETYSDDGKSMFTKSVSAPNGKVVPVTISRAGKASWATKFEDTFDWQGKQVKSTIVNVKNFATHTFTADRTFVSAGSAPITDFVYGTFTEVSCGH